MQSPPTKIANETVTDAKLANRGLRQDQAASELCSATSRRSGVKIDTAAITTDKIADSTVTTAKIADDAVTTAKILMTRSPQTADRRCSPAQRSRSHTEALPHNATLQTRDSRMPTSCTNAVAKSLVNRAVLAVELKCAKVPALQACPKGEETMATHSYHRGNVTQNYSTMDTWSLEVARALTVGAKMAEMVGPRGSALLESPATEVAVATGRLWGWWNRLPPPTARFNGIGGRGGSSGDNRHTVGFAGGSAPWPTSFGGDFWWTLVALRVKQLDDGRHVGE